MHHSTSHSWRPHSLLPSPMGEPSPSRAFPVHSLAPVPSFPSRAFPCNRQSRPQGFLLRASCSGLLTLGYSSVLCCAVQRRVLRTATSWKWPCTRFCSCATSTRQVGALELQDGTATPPSSTHTCHCPPLSGQAGAKLQFAQRNVQPSSLYAPVLSPPPVCRVL